MPTLSKSHTTLFCRLGIRKPVWQKLEVGILRLFYEIRKVELHGELDSKLVMEVGFIYDKAVMAAAVRRPEIDDMLFKK
jgi:hypothetical protein